MAELFDQAVFLKFLAALLAIFNPLYGIPIFLSMTKGYSAPERRRVAFIVTGTVIIVGLIAVVIGEEILAVFGIDIPSFRIAGGLIIFGIGMSMLNASDRSQGDQQAVEDGHRKKENIACLIVSLGLLFADPISRLLGMTMINVITRVMALILVAVAIEMVLTGTFNAIDAHYPGLNSGGGG